MNYDLENSGMLIEHKKRNLNSLYRGFQIEIKKSFTMVFFAAGKRLPAIK